MSRPEKIFQLQTTETGWFDGNSDKGDTYFKAIYAPETNTDDGGDEDEDKSFLQKDWWILIVLALVFMMILGVVAVL